MTSEARQIDPTRLAEYESAKLLHGSHPNIKQGGCLLEWAAYLAGKPHSDRPPCVSPSIAAFGRSWNDSLSEEKRQMLKPYAIRILGTASTPAAEDKRAWLAVDWLVREYTPAWLELAGLEDDAESLRGLPEVDARSVSNVIAVLGPMKARGAAAGDAAGDAARAAAWDAAGDAAWDAARAAARDAAGDAAWDAARAAAGAAAWDAAWDAAGAAAGAGARAGARAKLAPTVELLQVSALRLLDRMIAVQP